MGLNDFQSKANPIVVYIKPDKNIITCYFSGLEIKLPSWTLHLILRIDDIYASLMEGHVQWVFPSHQNVELMHFLSTQNFAACSTFFERIYWPVLYSEPHKKRFFIGILFVDMNVEMHSPLHALLQVRLYLYISVLSLHSVLLEQ